MSLNAVQLYLKAAFTGLAMPLTQQGVMSAYITPPNPAYMEGGPIMFVWGGTAVEAPKNVAQQEVRYNVDLWVYYADDNDNPLADNVFPVVIDTVTAKLRGFRKITGTVLTDPITGATSDLISVGRNMKVDYAPVKTLEIESRLLYLARIIVEVREWTAMTA